MALTRDEPLMQSAQDWVREYLLSLGYVNQFEFQEHSPDSTDTNPLEISQVVFSWADFDPPESLEVGGPLVVCRKRMLIDVLGKSERLGSNIASMIYERFASGEWMPLNDYSDSDVEEISRVEIDNVLRNRLNFANPAPWQRHWFTITVALNDEFNRLVS